MHQESFACSVDLQCRWFSGIVLHSHTELEQIITATRPTGRPWGLIIFVTVVVNLFIGQLCIYGQSLFPIAKFVQNHCNYLVAEELSCRTRGRKKKKPSKRSHGCGAKLHKLITGLTLNYMTSEFNTAQKNLYYNKDGQQEMHATTEPVMKTAFRLRCRNE